MDIVLVHPDIPWNTGNIGRTCVATGTRLHLIKPMGFTIDDRMIRRSGLDYWAQLDVTIHESLRAFQASDVCDRPMFLFSRFARRPYWDAVFPRNAVLIFGSETKGLPASFKAKHRDRIFKIPTPGPVRSLNLSTAAALVLYEALRQQK